MSSYLTKHTAPRSTYGRVHRRPHHLRDFVLDSYTPRPRPQTKIMVPSRVAVVHDDPEISDTQSVDLMLLGQRDSPQEAQELSEELFTGCTSVRSGQTIVINVEDDDEESSCDSMPPLVTPTEHRFARGREEESSSHDSMPPLITPPKLEARPKHRRLFNPDRQVINLVNSDDEGDAGDLLAITRVPINLDPLFKAVQACQWRE